MTNKLLFIPGAVPSSKNGRILTKTGLFIGSKATQKYKKKSAPYWKLYKAQFKKLCSMYSKPYIIGLHFVRGSRHKWDFINPAQTIQDEMTKAGWIEDDNILEILPVPLRINNQHWGYDKSNPGVYITILNNFCEEIINLPSNEINKPK